MRELLDAITVGLADLMVNHPRVLGFGLAAFAALGFLVFGVVADLSNVAPR